METQETQEQIINLHNDISDSNDYSLAKIKVDAIDENEEENSEKEEKLEISDQNVSQNDPLSSESGFNNQIIVDSNTRDIHSTSKNRDNHEEFLDKIQETFLTFDRNVVSQFEKDSLPQFFSGKYNRCHFNPDHYLRIRNIFLDEWESSRPNTLKYLEVLRNHRGVANVISFARVSKFLNSIGAINNDHVKLKLIGEKPCIYKSDTNNNEIDKSNLKKVSRKRKSYYLNEMGRLGIDPIKCGFTIPENELENALSVFSNNSSQLEKNEDFLDSNILEDKLQINGHSDSKSPNVERILTETKDIVNNNSTDFSSNIKKSFNVSSNRVIRIENDVIKDSRTRPNPFKLISCEKYAANMAPFSLRVSIEALAIIDVHSHCVQNEVIGLLGGLYCPKYRQLNILTAEPCESLTASTSDLQCEMDPVSQAEASEKLSHEGYHVVGWYHSHPTFVPNPSLRDLETQAKYQALFAEGNKPFLALILNPYTTSNQPKNSFASTFKCLMLNDQLQSGSSNNRIPYAFTPLLVRKEKLYYNLIRRVKDLCSRIEGRPSTLCITDKLKGKDIQYIQKLMLSLNSHFETTGLSSKECGILLEELEKILLAHLTKKGTK